MEKNRIHSWKNLIEASELFKEGCLKIRGASLIYNASTQNHSYDQKIPSPIPNYSNQSLHLLQ